jgi:hypothetical protein
MPSISSPKAIEGTTARGRLAVAIVASATVILAAPYLGQLRALIRTAFPGQFVAIVGGAVALALVAGLIAALVKIRERRAVRFGVIAGAVGVAVIYTLATATGNPEVDAVERVHFIEYGVLAYLFYAAWRPLGDPGSFILPVLAATIVGTLDEWLQWFVPIRVGEVRDVVLNVVAIACGLAFGAAVSPPAGFAFTLRPASRRLTAGMAAAAVLVLAGFVDVVHVGHVVRAEGIGEFRSRYSEAELRRIAGDRAARWARDPPLVLVRLSRADQYLEEGLWHVRERNRRWIAGDIDAAWRENLILETYFAPVLDTVTYRAPDAHRWPPEQRADGERQAMEAEAPPYVSNAEPLPIVAWPRPLFWLAAAVLAAALLRAGLRKATRAGSRRAALGVE